MILWLRDLYDKDRGWLCDDTLRLRDLNDKYSRNNRGILWLQYVSTALWVVSVFVFLTLESLINIFILVTFIEFHSSLGPPHVSYYSSSYYCSALESRDLKIIYSTSTYLHNSMLQSAGNLIGDFQLLLNFQCALSNSLRWQENCKLS